MKPTIISHQVILGPYREIPVSVSKTMATMGYPCSKQDTSLEGNQEIYLGIEIPDDLQGKRP